MEDIQLLCMLENDPNRGMELLLQTYAGLVYTIVRRTLPESSFCPGDIEGCVADTFSDFYCNLHLYDPSAGSIKTYLCAIARNIAVDFLRQSSRNGIPISPEDGEAVFSFGGKTPTEDAVLEKNLRTQVVRAVKMLEEPDRTILIRKYFHYQSSREIAVELGMSVSNVDTRTHRALKKLKKLLGGIYHEEKSI